MHEKGSDIHSQITSNNLPLQRHRPRRWDGERAFNGPRVSGVISKPSKPAHCSAEASIFTGLLTYEISRSVNAGLMASYFERSFGLCPIQTTAHLFGNNCVQPRHLASQATGIMAIIPAHIMRSVGGTLDDE